jgi:hypothetical protein
VCIREVKWCVYIRKVTRSEVSWSEVDYFIRCVLTISLGVLYYGIISYYNICVCSCNMYILTSSVFCLCFYLYCFVVILLFCVILMFCSCFVVLCIFSFVCTSVGLLPPDERPIAVSSGGGGSSSSSKCSYIRKLSQLWNDWKQKTTSTDWPKSRETDEGKPDMLQRRIPIHRKQWLSK